MKIVKEKGVGVCSLTRNTYGVRKACWAPKWGLERVTNESTIQTILHKLNNKLVRA
jgi:hypothetical protein